MNYSNNDVFYIYYYRLVEHVEGKVEVEKADWQYILLQARICFRYSKLPFVQPVSIVSPFFTF